MARNIEEKLKEYRRKKEAEIQMSSSKSIWEKVFPSKVAKTFTSKISNENVAAGFESTLQKISKVEVSEVVTHKESISDSSAEGEIIPERLRFREKTKSQKEMKQEQVTKYYLYDKVLIHFYRSLIKVQQRNET